MKTLGAVLVAALLAVALPAAPASAQADEGLVAPDTGDPVAVYRQLRQMRREGRAEEALAFEALLLPEVRADGRVVGERALSLIETGDWARAREILSAYPMDPQNTAVPMAVALFQLELRRGAVESVRQNVDLSLARVPNNIDLAVLDARLLIAEDKLPEAERAIAALPEEAREEIRVDLAVELKLAQAVEYMEDDALLSRAQPLLETAYELRPDRGDVRSLYVRFLSRWQRYDEGERIALEGLEAAASDEDRADLHYALGSLYRAAQRDDEAEEQFRKVLAIFPNHAKAKVGVARCRNRAGESDTALTILQECLARRPDDLDAMLAVAEIESGRERWSSALSMIERILDEKPNHLKALWMSSRLLARLGRTEEMEAVLAKYEARKSQLEQR